MVTALSTENTEGTEWRWSVAGAPTTFHQPEYRRSDVVVGVGVGIAMKEK